MSHEGISWSKLFKADTEVNVTRVVLYPINQHGFAVFCFAVVIYSDLGGFR